MDEKAHAESMTYDDATGAVLVRLGEFCDENLPDPAMIANAVMRASFEISTLRKLVGELERLIMNAMAENRARKFESQFLNDAIVELKKWHKSKGK